MGTSAPDRVTRTNLTWVTPRPVPENMTQRGKCWSLKPATSRSPQCWRNTVPENSNANTTMPIAARTARRRRSDEGSLWAGSMVTACTESIVDVVEHILFQRERAMRV